MRWREGGAALCYTPAGSHLPYAGALELLLAREADRVGAGGRGEKMEVREGREGGAQRGERLRRQRRVR
eukprot:2891056-Prymnesium_polylepis.1